MNGTEREKNKALFLEAFGCLFNRLIDPEWSAPPDAIANLGH